MKKKQLEYHNTKYCIHTLISAYDISEGGIKLK